MYCSYGINRYNTPDDVSLRVVPMTARWIKGFDTAKKMIAQSNGKHPGRRMGAAIFCGSRFLGGGANAYQKTNPDNAFGSTTVSLHAEQVAVTKIKHYEYTTKLICYVVRLNTSDEFVISKPCTMCIKYLQKHGVSIIRFINKDGDAEEMLL